MVATCQEKTVLRGAAPSNSATSPGDRPVRRPVFTNGRINRLGGQAKMRDCADRNADIFSENPMSIATEKLCAAALQHAKRASGKMNEFGISAAAYPHGRVAVLLSRYPALRPSEFEEVLQFVRRARPGQLQRLRSSAVVSTKLDDFLAQEHYQLMSFRERVVWTTTAVLMILALCWAFWAQRPHPITASFQNVQANKTETSLRNIANGPASLNRSS